MTNRYYDSALVAEGELSMCNKYHVVYLQTVVIAPFSVFGLLFEDLLESLGQGTQAVTLISNLTSSCSFLLGVVVNYVLTKYSCRQVGVVGSIIYFIGSFMCAFVNSMFLLAFAYGVLQGIGLGLMVPAVFTSFNHYFVRRRTFAMGITQVITGVGCMVIPIILQRLIEEYGTRGTQAIISAMGLNSLLSAIVQQPVEKHMKRKKRIRIQKQEFDSEKHGNIKRESCDLEMRIVNRKSDSVKETQISEITEGFCHNGFPERDKNISYESNNSAILTRETNASDADVINIRTKSDSRQESETNGNQNDPLGDHTENTKANILTEHFNEVLARSSEVNKQSQIITVDYARNQTEFDKYDAQEDDSVERRLLNDEYLKIHYITKRTSADLGSTTTGNPVSISDSRATVTSLRSWTSSCERRRRTNDDLSSLKPSETRGTHNVFSRTWASVVDLLDLRLLLDPVYVNIALGCSMSFFADVTYSTVFPLAILKMGYSRADTALCISIIAITDIFGRLCVALIGALCPKITSRALVFAGAVSSVIGRIIFVFFDDFSSMAILIGYLGFTRSFIHVPMPLVFAEYNIHRFPAAYGLSAVITGIICLSAGPLVGWVRDATNSYAICINTLNILQIVLCICPWTLEFIISRIRRPSKTKESSQLQM
ncbi:Monocarboxylate transporter 9 [Zootermopsis nevadensis]|uniref:Monocarboxylate transporter 9 n=1 Tax=Zootermopsis nevadensis TaxID=136037 RepID=A0A067REX3_ZOONE|nr:Monocarboxylate transporter 9 [Zootermopsis nevadensis]